MSDLIEIQQVLEKISTSNAKDEHKQKEIYKLLGYIGSTKNSKESKISIFNSLERTLNARNFAENYSTNNFKIPQNILNKLKIDKNTSHYHFHNDLFTAIEDFSLEDIKKIKEKLESNNLYHFETLENGLIRTSETIHEHMRWQWFTDTCMVGSWQKKVSRENWQKALLTNIAITASTKNTQTVKTITNNPEKYRQYIHLGIAHVFNPIKIEYNKNSIPEPDSYIESDWFYPKRVESLGLLHLNLIEEILYAIKKDSVGSIFHIQNQASRNLLRKSLDNLSKFILSINYCSTKAEFDMKAPSNSSWEEIVFYSGASFDAATCVLAIEKLKTLVENSSQNSSIRDFLFDKNYELDNSPNYANYLSIDNLNNFIKSGKSFLENRLLNQDSPVHFDERGDDTSLFLFTALDYSFSEDRLKNIHSKNQILTKAIEKLAGKNGFRRYNEFNYNNHYCFDSYLNLDFQVSSELPQVADLVLEANQINFEQRNKNANDLRDYISRQNYAFYEYSAEWTIGSSAALQAISKNLLEMKNHYQDTEEFKQTYNDTKLIANYLLNLNLAQICGSKAQEVYRADGTKLPREYVFIEAFQAVSDLNSKRKWLPGQHTLAWTQAQFLDAIDNLEQALS